MTPAEVLRKAKGLLITGWRQGNWASAPGRPDCYWDDPEANCFCLAGALHRAKEKAPVGVFSIVQKAIGLDWSNSLIDWNDEDGRTQDQVIAVLDRAIALTETAK